MNDSNPHGGQRIAVLGTGKMGTALAERLADGGHDLVLWNRTRSRADALGFGRVADTPAHAAADADLIISSLTGPEAIRAAYLGADGALAGGQGKRFVEMSTGGPDVVAELSLPVADQYAALLAAPILGAPPLVRQGQAAILLGGAPEDVEAVTPVLRAFGTVRAVGSASSAAQLKLVANSMLADVITAASELQVAGECAGLDADDVFWVIERLAPSLEARRDGLVHDRGQTLFALRDLAKDLALALRAFAQTGAATPLTRSAGDTVGAAAAANPDFDIAAIAGRYRQAAVAADACRPRRAGTRATA